MIGASLCVTWTYDWICKHQKVEMASNSRGTPHSREEYSAPMKSAGLHQLPSFYVFNANSIAKPHAKEQLHGDLLYYNIDIAVISESKLKKHHKDEFLALPNYHLYRRDRLGRGGSGIAIYAKDTYNCTECVVSNDNRATNCCGSESKILKQENPC